MKIKSFDKFRKWLIKKLGGYTELNTIKVPIIKSKITEPTMVKCSTLLNENMLSSPDYKEFMIKSAYNSISDYLYENKLCKIDYGRDEILGNETIVLTLWVMPPNWKEL